MLRTLIVEFLLPLLLFLLLRNLLRGLFTAAQPQRMRQAQAPPPVSPGGELKRDPVCGTYVSTAVGIRANINGQAVYFCSTACRDKYRG